MRSMDLLNSLGALEDETVLVEDGQEEIKNLHKTMANIIRNITYLCTEPLIMFLCKPLVAREFSD